MATIQQGVQLASVVSYLICQFSGGAVLAQVPLALGHMTNPHCPCRQRLRRWQPTLQGMEPLEWAKDLSNSKLLTQQQ